MAFSCQCLAPPGRSPSDAGWVNWSRIGGSKEELVAWRKGPALAPILEMAKQTRNPVGGGVFVRKDGARVKCGGKSGQVATQLSVILDATDALENALIV